MMLEDVLGLPTNNLPITRVSMSSHDTLYANCRKNFIKLTWLRNLKDRIDLIDENDIQRYVKCHSYYYLGQFCLETSLGSGALKIFVFALRHHQDQRI
ncbi:hypothetical protein AHAS_Ahas14G0160600 [Arachis hypogaea]